MRGNVLTSWLVGVVSSVLLALSPRKQCGSFTLQQIHLFLYFIFFKLNSEAHLWASCQPFNRQDVFVFIIFDPVGQFYSSAVLWKQHHFSRFQCCNTCCITSPGLSTLWGFCNRRNCWCWELCEGSFHNHAEGRGSNIKQEEVVAVRTRLLFKLLLDTFTWK